MIMKTLAQRIHRFGPPDVMELESVDLPQPGPGEVLIEVKAAGVGPWDAWVRSGKSALPQPLPLTLGADVSGVVLLAGPEAGHVSAGVEVYGVTNARFVGAYATHAIVDANRIARKPVVVDFVEAAGLPVVAVTAWKMLFELGQLRGGQRVLVHGASGNVGGLAVQMARKAGAIITAIGAPGDGDLLRRLGADEALDYDGAFEDRIEPVDLVIDTVGEEIQVRSLSVLKPGGALISSVNPPDAERAAALLVRAEFFIVDVTTQDLESVSELLTSGAITASVSQIFALANARQAHVLMEQPGLRQRGKIVLTTET
jgi:NADPH:quinone reductase-like Zn-dependent oxidoreductase